MKIEVKNCCECPFAYNDSNMSLYTCNINSEIYSEKCISDKVHEDCPLLKEEEIIIFVNK